MTLEIVLSSQQASPLTLAEALCGRAGKLVVGEQGVRLWSPEADLRGAGEIICDLRDARIAASVADAFSQAAEGRFLSARVALLPKADKELIKLARHYFDYILIPAAVSKNGPMTARNRVLGYIVEEKE